MQLTDWLLEHAEPLKPIVDLVIFTNPSVVIKSNHNNNQMLSRVTISEHLPEKLEQLQASYSVEKLTKMT
ncbi:hypothetical protein [Alkalicoccobacillus plakortidis]|uniref:Uncharacterized protein n=1 Tax=Alkalicoccobacillus plakortidis TaxID=444060 RepID=A0ABT0XPS9_9BACI|nr:hypothetical protein [Alkalicoccobacillus plakortidis]MCM2677812.1 hypothetical protein [Alkalicoccobacillus plakortidis]